MNRIPVNKNTAAEAKKTMVFADRGGRDPGPCPKVHGVDGLVAVIAMSNTQNIMLITAPGFPAGLYSI